MLSRSTPELSSPSAPALLRRNADFVRLWCAQAASQLAERSAALIVPLIAVTALSASAVEVGLVRAVMQAPALLLTLAFGALADRWRPRTTMIIPDLVRLLAAVVIAVAWLVGWLSLPILLIAAFVLGAMSLIFDLGYQLTLVRLVRPQQFGVANSALETARSGTQLAGPTAAGGLVSWLTAPIAMVLPALGWLAAAVLSASLRCERIGGWPRAESAAALPAAGQRRSIIADVADGLRLVLRHPLLRSIGLAAASFQFAFAALTTVYLVHLVDTLGLSAGLIGVIMAATGLGAVLGSVLAGWLPRRIGLGPVMAGAAVSTSLVVWAIPFAGGAAVAVILIAVNAVVGACGQLVDVQTTTIRQAVTPVPLQGRVISTLNLFGIGLAPVGSLAGGWLADLTSTRTALLAAGVAMIISPLVIILSPLGRVGRDLLDVDRPAPRR